MRTNHSMNKIGNTTTIAPSSGSDYTMNDQDIMDRIHTRVNTPRSTNTKQIRRVPKVNNNAEATLQQLWVSSLH